MISQITREQLEAVKDLDEDKDVSVFISMAHELVVQYLGASNYSDTRLTLIEQWLAAHFYCIWERKAYSETAGEVSSTYESKIGLFLKLTHEGQQAMLLDTDGILRALDSKMESGGKANVSVSFIGNLQGLGC